MTIPHFLCPTPLHPPAHYIAGGARKIVYPPTWPRDLANLKPDGWDGTTNPTVLDPVEEP